MVESGRRRGRALRVLLVLAGVLLLLFVVLHLGPVQDQVEQVIESQVASRVDGSFDIGNLDYRLWLGEATLEDVVLELDEGILSRASIERVEVDYRFPTGIGLRVVRPDVLLEASPEDETAEEEPQPDQAPSSIASLVPAFIEALQVEGGELRYSDPAASLEARLAPFEATMTADGLTSAREIAISADDGEVTWESREIEIESLEAEGVLTQEALRLDAVELVSSAGTVAVEGPIESFSPFVADLDVEHDLALGPMLPETQGEISGTASVVLADETISAEGQFRASGLSRGELGPYSGEGTWSLADEVLAVDADLSGQGLVLDAGVRLDLAEEAQSFDIELEAGSLQQILAAAGGPSFPWESSLRLTASMGLSGFEPSTLDGEATIALSQEGAANDLSGSIDVVAESGDLRVTTENLAFPGGRLEATAQLQDLESLSASYRLVVDQLGTAVGPWVEEIPAAIDGNLDVSGEVTGDLGNLDGLRVTAQLDGSQLGLGDAELTLDGSLAYEGGGVQLENVSVQTAQGGELALSGQVPLEDGELSVDGRLTDFPLATFTSLADLPLEAEATGSFEATGSLESPEADAELDLSSIEYAGQALPPLSLDVDSEAGEARVSASLTETGEGFLQASVGLEEPYPTDAEIELDPLPWSTISNLLPEFAGDVPALDAYGRLQVSGPLTEPSELEVQADIDEISATLGELELTTSAFQVQGGLDALDVSGLTLREGGEDLLTVEGRLPLEGALEGELDIDLEVGLDRIEEWVPGVLAGGTARADLRLSGGLSEPRLFGTIDVEDARYVQDGLSLDSLDLSARATGTEIRIDSLEAELLDGRLTAEGAVPLPLPGATGGEAAGIEFDVTGIDPTSLQAEGELPDFETSVSLSGEIRFPEGDFSEIRASGELEEVFLATEGAVVSLAAAAAFLYGPQGFTTEPIELEGGETDLRVAVEALGGEGEAPVSVDVAGQLDLVLGNVVLPETMFLSGVVRFDGVEVRVDEGIQLAGSGSLAGVELVNETPPLVLTNVDADLDLDDRTITLSALSGELGGGELSGEGRVVLPRGEETLDVRLSLEAERVRLEYPEGLRSQISADLQLLSGEEDRFRLEGAVRIEEAIYDERISPERELVAALRRESLELAEEPGLAGRISLDIDVQSERDLVIDNNLGQLQASTDLLVTGTVAAPEVSGTVRAVPGGRLTFGANAYEIESARVSLTSFPVLPPDVEIRATTEVGGRDIVLEVVGRTDNLRTTIESPTDPSLSRADVASLLLTGRTVEEVRGEEGEVLGEQAASYFGGALAELTSQGLSEALPVTTVQLDPSLVGRETDPGVRFSVGQAITEDLFLTYSIGLNDAEKQLWIIDYDLPYRLQMRAIREDGNEYTGALSQDLFFDFFQRRRPTTLPEDEPRPEIVDVRLEGSIPLERTAIADAIELEPGDDYDYWSAREDTGRIVERLGEAGYLNARASVETMPPEADADSNDIEEGQEPPVILTYEVEPGPRVEIEWTGDPIEDELVRWVREEFKGYLPPRAHAARLQRELTYRLMSEGFYGASVESSVDATAELARVVFDVELGPRGEEVVVELVGAENVGEEDLMALLPDPSEPEFFEQVVGQPEELREELALLYASRGFLAAEVVDLGTTFATGEGRFTVEIEVEEGELFAVGEVALEGADTFGEGELRELVLLEEGQPFRLDTYLEDRRDLASFYRREGFPDVVVSGELERTDANVSVLYTIAEGERVSVGTVIVGGARATGEGVIRDAVTFEPGDPLRLSELTETQSNLYDLQIFRAVDIEAVPTGEPGVQNVVIEVEERPDLRVGYGSRYSTEDGFELSGDLQFPNVLGGARQLALAAFVNRRQQIYRVNLSSPYFFTFDVDTNVFISRELEETDEFDAQSWTVTFQQGRPLRDQLRLQWSASYDRGRVVENVATGPFGFDIQAVRSSLNVSLIEDTRDSLTRPRSGRFWTVFADYAPTFLGSDLNFVKLYGQVFLYRSLTDRFTYASSYRAGIASGFDQTLLPEDRFRAGGPNSVRGFPVNELGDPDPLTGTPIGGEGIIVMNQELRFPLFWWFGGVTFYDVGNVYLEASDFDPLDLRHSVGVGLTVDLPVGLVSIDWARILNPPEGLDKSRLHLSFGYAF